MLAQLADILSDNVNVGDDFDSFDVMLVDGRDKSFKWKNQAINYLNNQQGVVFGVNSKGSKVIARNGGGS